MAAVDTRFFYELPKHLKSKYPEQDLSLFFIRLGARFDGLMSLYRRLYGEREDFEVQFRDLICALAEMYIARPADLKDLDQQRELEDDWYMSPNWIATMLYVDRFSNDLQGFTKKISYLEELGVNYVHLMPLLKMPKEQNDGGYAVIDYRSVDERFGSMDDLRGIARTFRDKNMLLELDLVLNHTSDEHEWALQALAGDQEAQDMYYFYPDRHLPDRYEKTTPEVFPDTAPGNFTHIPALDKWVWTTFNTYQWDLNYTNPRVFTEMVKILLNLANEGVDILRLDAVAFMWKRLDTSSQNLEEAHQLLQLFKVCAKITAPGVLFKAEAIVQPREIVKYLGEGGVDECEIAYNASLMVYLWDTMATQNKLILEQGLRNTPRLPEGTTWINYIRCHDDIGLGYADEDILHAGFDPFDHRQFIIEYYVGEYPGSPSKGQRFMYNPKTKDARITGSTASLLGLEHALEANDTALVDACVRKILLMHSVIMSFGGIPLVYYGDEIASLNDYSFLQDETKNDDSRWLNRPVIDWDRVAKREQRGTVEQQVFDGLKKMIALRKTMPEFNSVNNYQVMQNGNPGVFSFLREHEWHRTLVLVNLTGAEQKLPQHVVERAGLGHFVRDVYADKKVEAASGNYLLQPYQFMWLQQR